MFFKNIINSIVIFSIFLINNSVSASNAEELKKYSKEIQEIKSILSNHHDVSEKYVDQALNSIKFRQKTLDSMTNAVERKATWERYRNIFINRS